jgi:hypothetical protein
MSSFLTLSHLIKGGSGMYSNWKSVLYEYVHHKNQIEVNSDLQALVPLLSDDSVIRRKRYRIQRLQESRHDRQAEPLKNETRLRLRNITDEGYKVTVDIDLRLKHAYLLRGQEHTEERMEHERVTILREGRRWAISRFEEFAPERSSRSFETAFSDGFDSTESAGKALVSSAPYLNRELLNPYTGGLRGAPYNRARAVQYADAHWDRGNPRFLEFEVNCTNYISQCLFAGGAPMNYTGKRESGWWYKGRENSRELWSYSWAVAHSLEHQLRTARAGLRGQLVESPQDLELGDVIIYDWDGDRRFQHSTIVTAFDAAGMPLVNANTASSRHRYWDYRDSYAWTPSTVYRFFHMTDQF